MFIELVKGIALQLAMCYLYGFNERLWRHPFAKQVFAGLLFGSLCVVGMHTPLVLEPGVFFDARSIVLSMAGLFGGLLSASIAAAVATTTRLWLGGPGAEIALQMIFLCVAFGLAYRYACKRGWLNITPLSLACFGLLLHIATLALLQLLPSAIAQHINERFALLFLLTFTPATVLFGLLLRAAENQIATQRALSDTAARLHAITSAIPDVLLVLDEQGCYVEVLSVEQASSMPPTSQLVGKHLREVLPASEADRLAKLIHGTLASGRMHSIEYEVQTQNGLRYYEGRSQPLGVSVNGRAAVVFLARDITERKQAETALFESELRFRSLLRNVPSISVQGYLENGTTTYWNKASEQLYGYTSEEAIGSNLLDLIIPTHLHRAVRKDMRRMFSSGAVIPAGELQLRRKNGSLVDVFSSHTLIEVPGQPPEMFCIDIDISRRKAAEEEAFYLAFYDALTRLPNRHLLMDRLKQAILERARTGKTAAVLFIDLDNFKLLNDTRGHAVGDLLLQQVALRLRNSVRKHDTLARLGGDEFVVVLQNLSSDAAAAATQVRRRAEIILIQLCQPYNLADRSHHFSASIGAALICDQPKSADEVLKQADMAMYCAKDNGRNTLRFFDPEMQQVVNRRAMLEAELHDGLRQKQFQLFYQPQVDQRGHVIGAEVLVRWSHPTQGIILPSEFIPLAEETGLILPLGQWILETALRQQARWRGNPALQYLNLAINVSTRQFRHEGFVAKTVAMLQATGADPARIKLEMTESFLLQDVESAIATMHALRAHGLEFSLDDFGTGYSSLNYLKRLPLSEIKIDQGFVAGVLQDPKDASIACSLIELANNLDLSVIAEGVETREHYQFLLTHGCKAFQGYLFGRPMTLEEFEHQACTQGLPRH